MEFKINNYPYFFDKDKAMVIYNMKYCIYMLYAIQYRMTKLVSIRVDEQTMAEAKRLKINYSEIMRESLKKEIERRNEKDFLESLSKIHRMLKNVDPEQLLSDLRKR